MSNIRASGYQMKDRDDDESFQMLVGDVERLTIALRKGADIGPGGSTVGGSAENAGALLAVNNLGDILDAATARINLGITDSGGGSLFLQVANDLSDLNSASTARTNLGLGSIATQNANNVAITGGSITGITDLAVTDGGTGASTASGARTNLGLGSLATLNTATVGVGGTGITSYTIGDIIYANGTSTLAALAGVATGNALVSGGVGTAPSWGKIALTTHVSGTLPEANGGTGTTSADMADLPILSTATVTTLTSGSGATHTFASSTKWAMIFLRGPGGNGGDASAGSGSGSYLGGGGGGGGTVWIMAKVTGSSDLTYSVGTPGSNTSVTYNGITFVAAFGNGGSAYAGGSAGTYTLNGSATRFFAGDRFLAWGVPGIRGEDSKVRSVSYDGAGAVTAISHRHGEGGLWGGGAGATAAGGTGTAGSNGQIVVYELAY